METLKKVLIVNSLSSGATGILLTLIPGTAAKLFNSPVTWPFVEVGMFLILFAGLVYYCASLKTLNAGLVKSIITMDVVWVTASLILIATGAFNLSGIGYLLTGSVAAWVALMAYLQSTSLKRALPERKAAL